jgi:hypothetical protein
MKKLENKYRILYKNVPVDLATSYFSLPRNLNNFPIDIDTTDSYVRSFDKSKIKKATPEEIEKYLISMNQKKYNL